MQRDITKKDAPVKHNLHMLEPLVAQNGLWKRDLPGRALRANLLTPPRKGHRFASGVIK
jgi:hypothetical protein